MSVQSYPFIAVDYNGNEYHREARGRSQGDAASRFLREHSNFRELLNGKQGSPNNPYRKLIRAQHGVEPDATRTSLKQALLEAQSTQSLEAARLILSALQKKGLRLDITDDTGIEKIVVKPKGIITPEECAEIDENQASILVLLREQEQQTPYDEEPVHKEPPSKETQRDIIRKMIPELPEHFLRYDLEQALHRWEYHDLADKSSKLDSLLAWCATQGLIIRIGKGRYAQPPKTVPRESSDGTGIESVAPAEQQLPKPETLPAATSVVSTEVIDGVNTIDQPVVTIEPERPAPRPFSQVLIDLTSALATAPVDESRLEAIERGIAGFYEFVENVEALVKHVRTNGRARDRFRAQLASTAESEA